MFNSVHADKLVNSLARSLSDQLAVTLFNMAVCNLSVCPKVIESETLTTSHKLTGMCEPSLSVGVPDFGSWRISQVLPSLAGNGPMSFVWPPMSYLACTEVDTG